MIPDPLLSGHGRVDVPDIDLPLRQRAVRSVVLSVVERKRRSVLSPLLSMSFPAKTFSFASVVAIALVAVFTFDLGASGTAQARDLVDRAMFRAVKLSAEQRAEIEKNIQSDLAASLEEAKNAPDLEYVGAEELSLTKGPYGISFFNVKFEGDGPITASGAGTVDFKVRTVRMEESGGVMMIENEAVTHPMPPQFGTVSVGSGTEHADFAIDSQWEAGERIDIHAGTAQAMPGSQLKAPVKILKYTDPQGRKVSLGLDENDIPVFKMMEIDVKDVIVGDGNTIAIPATNIHPIGDVDLKMFRAVDPTDADVNVEVEVDAFGQ